MPIDYGDAHVCDLVELVESQPDRLVPFLGAGMAKALGYPLWPELVAQICAAAGESVSNYQAAYDASLASDPPNYPEALSILQKAYGRPGFAHRVRQILKAAPGDIAALAPLGRLKVRLMLTTNLDNSLKAVLGPSAVVSVPVDGREFPAEVERPISGVRLVKWHGEIEHDRTWVLTKEQYDEFYGEEWRVSWIKDLGLRSTLLFAGYSLNDPDFAWILRQVARRFGGAKAPHLALLRRGDAVAVGREAVIPILYDTHSEVLGFFRFLADHNQPMPGPSPTVRTPALPKAGPHRLPPVRSPSELSGDAALLGIDEPGAPLPAIRLERDDQAHVQSVASILERLRRNAPIVILVGPQLCGKTWLARAVVQHLEATEGTPASVHHEVVPPQAVANALPALNLAEFGRARFQMYALWARRMVGKVMADYAKNFPDVVLAMERDPKFSSVFRYRDIPGVAEADIRSKWDECQAASGADFVALQRSVLGQLVAAEIPDPRLFLVLEIEDLHLHGVQPGTKRELAQTALRQFWKIIREYAEARRVGPSRDSGLGSLWILVTSRQVELETRRPSRLSPVTAVSAFSEPECLRYAERAGLASYFPGDDLRALAHSAHKETAGYAWFVARFLRAAAFLRANGVTTTPVDLAATVAGVPHFWYWDRPFSPTVWPDISEAATAGDASPEPGYRSRFLQSVYDVFSGQPDLISRYRTALRAEVRSYCDTDVGAYLLPLLRCGLIQWRADGQGFEAPNRIVLEHFGPDQLEAVLPGIRGDAGSTGGAATSHPNGGIDAIG